MDNPWNNPAKQAHHLHQILERVQRQQQRGEEMNHQGADEDQPSTSQSPQDENGANATPSEASVSGLLVTTSSNPQDQVLDLTKGNSRSTTSRLQEVPTYQTSIFSGEFRNSADLQNFERLLEIRSAKRRGKN